MIEPVRAWFDITAGEIRAAIVAAATAILSGLAFVVTWGFRIESRVTALEQDRKESQEHNTADHSRIEQKLDRLIEVLIEKRN